MQDINGGTPRAVTPEGVLASAVSGDGTSMLARDADGRLALYPVAGGAPHVLVAGLDPALLFVQWSADGRSIYVRDDKWPTSIYKVDLATGNKSAMLQLKPSDPSGVINVQTVVVSRDGKSYAYNYRRVLTELLVVEGLK